MIIRIRVVKTLEIVLLVATGMLGGCSNETISVKPYEYEKTPPISLGEIKDTNDAFIQLKLRFRADSTEGYPNIFQTAQGNSGMRMEISGSTAAIVVSDKGAWGGIKVLPLSVSIKAGQWYELEVEAKNGKYIKAKLDGVAVEYTSTSLSMDTSGILVGSGYSASRTFHGQIENISITKTKS